MGDMVFNGGDCYFHLYHCSIFRNSIGKFGIWVGNQQYVPSDDWPQSFLLILLPDSLFET